MTTEGPVPAKGPAGLLGILFRSIGIVEARAGTGIARERGGSPAYWRLDERLACAALPEVTAATDACLAIRPAGSEMRRTGPGTYPGYQRIDCGDGRTADDRRRSRAGSVRRSLPIPDPADPCP